MPDDGQEVALAPFRQWLAAFEQMIARGDLKAVGKLFRPDSYWRDIVAFTWHLETVSGADEIAVALTERYDGLEASAFELDTGRTKPRLVTRAGVPCAEGFFTFRTRYGRGNGILRLYVDAGGAIADPAVAWTLLTALDELDGADGSVEEPRPTERKYSKDFSGPNWLDDRKAAKSFAGRDPAVLVVGAGQAGLSIAARLGQFGVDTLVVDQEQRIGDNWRNRYHALSLHNQVHVNHLPYMPFPPTFPVYIPKDKLANWFEAYAESMELNCWAGVTFSGGTYDERAGRWSVDLSLPDGKVRTMAPRHVVMATGASGVPNIPDIPGLADFGGAVLHSSAYTQGADWSGKNVLVIGTGTSGHDIAQDLHSHGAHVTMVQRNSTMVLNVEPSAQLPYTLYDEGPPLDDCDLLTASMPFRLMRKSHQMLTDEIKKLDRDLLDGLARAGFRLNFGWDESGWQFKYLERGGGYYFNVGCSDLIIDGRVGLVQVDDIEGFDADGVRMRNGDPVEADLIVLATGYKGQEHVVRLLFGAEVAERVGPIWGFDSDQHELRNMFVRTGQPGLWFIAGSFAQCRIYSKYLALQIKAREDGLIPPVR